MSKSNFARPSDVSQNVHFSKALMGEAERSRMSAAPLKLTTFNAGDIVPIYCREILPNQELSLDVDFTIRQTTLLTPTMGTMVVDIYAFFVPNRIVNRSWPAVMGENLSGSWTANQVSLAPLVPSSAQAVQVPVGSVADYYDFPTQAPIPASVLSLCHDLKFRGYLAIYNEHFRDQNYQPPIPFSTLNVHEGFMLPVGSNVNPINGTNSTVSSVTASQAPDGSLGAGAIKESIYGQGSGDTVTSVSVSSRLTTWSALSKPLKANKRHDYFTSVLPSPQKSESSIFAAVTGALSSVPVVTVPSAQISGVQSPLLFASTSGGALTNTGRTNVSANGVFNVDYPDTPSGGNSASLYPSNLVTQAGAEITGLGFSIDDLRMASAIQRFYEVQASGGTRYRELTRSFFGIEAEDPYSDVPKCLGKLTRELDLYQTAQTSSSDSTPQGNLAAFGYTNARGHLFHNTFLEHGYVHVFAIVRHRNIYSSYLGRDNFRLNALDFYTPQMANISNQPVFTREINPYAPNPNNGFGYQEAWAEYRFEPDLVSGEMRPQPSGTTSLALWNYADDFDSSLQIATGTWLQSNSEEVLNRSLAVTSDQPNAPQFKAAFRFGVDKVLPMPTFSVPGMDII